MFLPIPFASSTCEFKDSLPVFGSVKEQRKNESRFPGSLPELQLTLFSPGERKGIVISICKKNEGNSVFYVHLADGGKGFGG